MCPVQILTDVIDCETENLTRLDPGGLFGSQKSEGGGVDSTSLVVIKHKIMIAVAFSIFARINYDGKFNKIKVKDEMLNIWIFTQKSQSQSIQCIFLALLIFLWIFSDAV